MGILGDRRGLRLNTDVDRLQRDLQRIKAQLRNLKKEAQAEQRMKGLPFGPQPEWIQEAIDNPNMEPPPSPDAIEAAVAEINSEWDDDERLRRIRCYPSNKYDPNAELPDIVHMREPVKILYGRREVEEPPTMVDHDYWMFNS